MLAKYWKRIVIIILIVACIINIGIKLLSLTSFNKAIDDVKEYIQEVTDKNTVNNQINS